MANEHFNFVKRGRWFKSLVFFSLSKNRWNSDFPIFADVGSVSVVWSSKFVDFHISPLRTWIRTPFSANFTNFAVSKTLYRQTLTKKRNFHQIMCFVNKICLKFDFCSNCYNDLLKTNWIFKFLGFWRSLAREANLGIWVWGSGIWWIAFENQGISH